jgi:hypothetical protein
VALPVTLTDTIEPHLLGGIQHDKSPRVTNIDFAKDRRGQQSHRIECNAATVLNEIQILDHRRAYFYSDA